MPFETFAAYQWRTEKAEIVLQRNEEKPAKWVQKERQKKKKRYLERIALTIYKKITQQLAAVGMRMCGMCAMR